MSRIFNDEDCDAVSSYFNIGDLIKIRRMTGAVYEGIYLGIIIQKNLYTSTGLRHMLVLRQGHRTRTFLLSNLSKVTKLTEVNS